MIIMRGAKKYRWTVVTLLFFATTINYLDRQVIGLLKDALSKDLHWSEKDYSNIIMAFSATYAICLLAFGRLIDRIGTKAGYGVAIVVWSAAAISHAFARTTLGFGLARASLGAGEAGNFPAAIKSVAEWFPKKDRALATGIFNSGTNVASIIGPPVIAWIFTRFGWQQAFVFTGALGLIWLIFWTLLYQHPANHKKISEQEYKYIHSDDQWQNVPDAFANSSKKLLGYRQTWSFVVGKFLTDPIWWFYLFWVPSYFNTTYSLNLNSSAVHVSTVYVVASFGSILGGYLSGWLIKKGWPVAKARKTAMFVFACCVAPIVLVRFTHQIWVAVALISLAAAAHQGWSATIFTTASDVFPKKAVSSIVGIGGMAGSVGGILFPLFIGIVLDHFKAAGRLSTGYNIIFAICSSSYLVAWLCMHFLTSKMRKLSI